MWTTFIKLATKYTWYTVQRWRMFYIRRPGIMVSIRGAFIKDFPWPTSNDPRELNLGTNISLSLHRLLQGRHTSPIALCSFGDLFCRTQQVVPEAMPWLRKWGFHRFWIAFPLKMTSWMERGGSQTVPGRESKEGEEGFHRAAGPSFCLGNMRVVNWNLLHHSTLLYFSTRKWETNYVSELQITMWPIEV